MARMDMPPGPGRPRGSRNKLPLEARAYVMEVAAQLEAEGRGMLEWARSNETDFWSKIYKAVVPREVDANVSGNVRIIVATGIERAPDE